MVGRTGFCLIFIFFCRAATESSQNGDNCKESTTYFNLLCFNVTFTCPDRCHVLYWPDPSNVYKSSECNGCTCSYCYTGPRGETNSFNIPMTSSHFEIILSIHPVIKDIDDITVSRQDLQNLPFTIPVADAQTFLPARWDNHIQDLFTVDYSKSIVSVQLKKDITPPDNGHLQLYFYSVRHDGDSHRKEDHIDLFEWNLIWYSQPRCNVSYLLQSFLNDPLLSVDCENPLQRPIVFSSSSGHFQMKYNLLYLKDLSTYGSHKFYIAAKFKDLDDSTIVPSTYLILIGPNKDKPVVTGLNCEATFHFDRLNYTSLKLYSTQMGLKITLINTKDYVIFLPSNETIIFNLKVDNDMEYTITTKSPEYCCTLSKTDVIKDLCFNVILTCPGLCPVSVWPDFVDLYKFSECKGCKCSYCYIGDGGKEISHLIPMTSPHFYLRFRPPRLTKSQHWSVLPYHELLSSFPYYISHFGWMFPVQYGSYFHDFFTLDYTGSRVLIQLKKHRTPPRNGHFLIYLYYTKFDDAFSLNEEKLTWYSPPSCRVSYLPWNFPNSPLLYVYCENPIQWKIICSSSNSNFQMKHNLMFLKDVTTRGSFNFYITAKYKGLRDSATRVPVSLTLKGKKICPAETNKNIKWPETVENTIANATCSEEFSGTISRFCSTGGIWDMPDKSYCLKKSISHVKSKLHNISSVSDKGFESAIKNLANATKQSIGAKDITETIDALKVVSTITNKSKEVTKKEIKNVINVIDNLIKGDTKTAWTKLEDKHQSSAASILKLMEDFGNIASQKVNETVSITRDNLMIQYEKVNVDDNLHFPAKNSSQPKWVEESASRIFIPSTILKNKFGANESVSMNAVIFRNMKDLLPQSKNKSSGVNSHVLSISFGKKLINLTENVLLSFTHLSAGYKEPSCNFWDFNINPEFGGYWSTRGCEVSFSNSTYTQCSCDHLTNFAILMNVVQHKHRKVLGIITKVGCSISIIALIFTIIIYAICWKSVTSQDVCKSQSILLMNLCVSLILAFLIFLTLVEGPREKITCTVIAALLHYFFLVVFFTMLAEGVDMTITVTVVFITKFNRLKWLLVSCWVAPAIIVGISLGITRTHGFGNDVFCWLTLKNNVIWYFIIPALIIILSNFVSVVLIIKSLLSTNCMLQKNVKQRLRTGARAIGILTPLFGFTWIFGIFAVNEKTVVFEYIFTVASSLQGIFIFIAYIIFNKHTRKGLNLMKGQIVSRTSTKQSTHATKSTDLNSSGKYTSRNTASFSELVESHYPAVKELNQLNPEDIFKPNTL